MQAGNPAPGAAPATPAASKPPRPAATAVVMRDGPNGVEVLLLRRAERGDHTDSAWVFPGGNLDARDRDCHALCEGLSDADASARVGLASGGLDYFVAAIRECFEEAGLLLAHDRAGALVNLHGDRGAEMLAWRGPLHRGERTFVEFCRTFGLTLAVERLVYHARWVTPTTRAKRWDTRFFLVEAPLEQVSAHDDVELLEQLWLRPQEAIERSESLKLLTPTRTTLQAVAGFASVRAMLEHAREPRAVALEMPRIGLGALGVHPIAADHFAWAEVGKLDPQGHGHASYEITAGVPVRLSPRVIRVTAGNPGVMTGPGTNTYLVRDPQTNDWAVIDPGPADDAHVDRVIAAAPGPIRSILVTHTHSDHSPGAVRMHERTGAPVLGRVARFTQNQDPSFRPDRVLEHGDRVEVGAATTLRVVHTPGHASNHLCYLLEQEQTLFTGDHVMQASTVVIGPPDGDMAAYLASLRAMLDVELEWLAPGHGFLIANPRKVFEGIIAHRLKREDKVVQALRALGPAEPPTLLARVYDDVAAGLHPVAMRSLLAHLYKLRDDGTALERDGRWSLKDG